MCWATGASRVCPCVLSAATRVSLGKPSVQGGASCVLPRQRPRKAGASRAVWQTPSAQTPFPCRGGLCAVNSGNLRVTAPRKPHPGAASGLPPALPAVGNEPGLHLAEQSRCSWAGKGLQQLFASISQLQVPRAVNVPGSGGCWPRAQVPRLASFRGALFSCWLVKSNKRLCPCCSSSLLLPRALLCQIPLALGDTGASLRSAVPFLADNGPWLQNLIRLIGLASS